MFFSNTGVIDLVNCAKSADESAAPFLWDGLIAAYVPLLGPTGLQLVDVVGLGNHLGFQSSMVNTDWVIDGDGTTFRGYVVDFDGVDDLARTPDPSPFQLANASAFGIITRFRANNNSFNGSADLLIDATEDGFSSTSGGVWISMDDRGGQFTVEGITLQMLTSGGDRRLRSNNNIIGGTDTWYHLCIGSAGVNGTDKIRLDGVDEFLTVGTPGNSGTFSPTGEFAVAGRTNAESGNEGQIRVAYVLCYDRVPSDENVDFDFENPLKLFERYERRTYLFVEPGGALQGTGTIAAVATVSGNATLIPGTLQGTGTVAVTSTVSGAAEVIRQGAGTIASVLTMSGAATATRQGAGTIGAAVTITGNATLASPNLQGAGTIAAAVAVTGAATRRRSAAGTISASLTMTGTTTQVLQAFGTITITVTISGSAGEDGPDVAVPRPSFIKSRGRVFGRSAQGQVGRRRGSSTAGTR